VTKSTITAQIHKPLYIHGNLSSQVTLDLVVAVNYAAYGVYLLFGEKICLGVAVHTSFVKNLL
jgi:hypothetical protein